MLGGPPTRSGFPPPSGRVTPPRCGLFLLRRSHSSWAEEKCPEAEQQPVTRCQAWRSLARTAQHDQLLLEQKILRDHRAHATGATQRRGHDGQVKQGVQEGLHARDSVGQTSGATPRCLKPGCSQRIGNSRRTGGFSRENWEFETHSNSGLTRLNRLIYQNL